MTPLIYDLSLAAGLMLIGAGVGMVSIPAALISVGMLIIGLTLFAALMLRSVPKREQ